MVLLSKTLDWRAGIGPISTLKSLRAAILYYRSRAT